MLLRLALLALCVALSIGLPQVPKLYRRKPIPIGIVGGDEAAPGEFPHQISMQVNSIFGRYHSCGGSVYNENYVITAAHCTEGLGASDVVVVAGEYDLSVESGDEQTIDAEALTAHESFDTKSMENDVALIKLSTPLVINDMVKAIELPAQLELVEPGTVCTTTGWGTTSEGGSLPDKLRKVDVPVVADESCRESYGASDIVDSMLCAGYPEGGKDTCQGDSGGPFVCGGKLHGIVSWGYGCARPNYPGVYTEVAYFRDWIEEHAV
ncbi:trypsin-1-like [Macrobrachium rosenbergii]|uniref:trypsin-1-like n=1 Tax=Macrobrachium rosenbergii TaxID=79674 RepID=UPI0034D639FA